MKYTAYERSIIASLVAAYASALSLPLNAAPQLIATSNPITVDAVVIAPSAISVSFVPSSPGGMTLSDLQAFGTKIGELRITESGSSYDTVIVSDTQRLVNSTNPTSGDPANTVSIEITSNGIAGQRESGVSGTLMHTNTAGSTGWLSFPSPTQTTVLTIRTSDDRPILNPGIYAGVIDTLIANK